MSTERKTPEGILESKESDVHASCYWFDDIVDAMEEYATQEYEIGIKKGYSQGHYDGMQNGYHDGYVEGQKEERNRHGFMVKFVKEMITERWQVLSDNDIELAKRALKQSGYLCDNLDQVTNEGDLTKKQKEEQK